MSTEYSIIYFIIKYSITNTGIRCGVKIKTNLAITMIVTDIIYADLITVTGVLIQEAFVDVHTKTVIGTEPTTAGVFRAELIL